MTSSPNSDVRPPGNSFPFAHKDAQVTDKKRLQDSPYK
jgi:hypothetical protein